MLIVNDAPILTIVEVKVKAVSAVLTTGNSYNLISTGLMEMKFAGFVQEMYTRVHHSNYLTG